MSILLGCNKQERSQNNFSEITNEQFPQQVKETVTTKKPVQIEEKNRYDNRKKEYEVQIMASQNLEKLLKEKKKFEQVGYNLKVLKKKIKHKTFYRLRLAENFTYSEAKNIADNFKKEFNQTQKIWVQKTK